MAHFSTPSYGPLPPQVLQQYFLIFALIQPPTLHSRLWGLATAGFQQTANWDIMSLTSWRIAVRSREGLLACVQALSLPAVGGPNPRCR